MKNLFKTYVSSKVIRVCKSAYLKEVVVYQLFYLVLKVQAY
jgi:hypothetical protein